MKILKVFDENVDFNSFKENVSITPELVGTWQTDDYKTLVYLTSAMQKDTKYEIKINKERFEDIWRRIFGGRVNT